MSNVAQLIKSIGGLPAVLEPSAIYYDRSGSGFDIYVTTAASPVIAHKVNMTTLLKNGINFQDANYLYRVAELKNDNTSGEALRISYTTKVEERVPFSGGKPTNLAAVVALFP